MTQREKDDELHKARVHVQFVCRMYRLQHEEGRYFLHEHRESELPRREDCVNEVQERCQVDVRQSRWLQSVVSQERRECGLDEKPPTMMIDCLAIAFTLNRRYPKHLESSEAGGRNFARNCCN